jgi:hypothetical protein
VINLADARRSGQLAKFIAEQEAQGIGLTDKREVESVVKQVVKEPTPQDQASSSCTRGGLSGESTR